MKTTLLFLFVGVYSLFTQPNAITTNKKMNKKIKQPSTIHNWFVKGKENGTFFIYDITSEKPIKDQMEISFNGSVLNYRKKPVSLLKYGNLKLDENQFNPDSLSSSYSGRLKRKSADRNLKIELQNSVNSVPEFVTSLYLAEPFLSNLLEVPDTISPQTTIFWNKDSLNKKGVIIILEGNFNPKEPLDFPRLDKHLIVPDTGSYTFTEEDLLGFDSSNIYTINIGLSITLSRGDIKMVASNSNKKIVSKFVFTTNSKTQYSIMK